MISLVEAQLISSIISIFAGTAIGLLFDLYRTINYFTRPNKNFLHLMDLLFWVISGSIVFFILLSADFGLIRVYTFLGICIGVFIYFKLFSEYILRFYRFIIYFLLKILRITITFILLPFNLLYNFIWLLVNKVKMVIRSILNRMINIKLCIKK